MYDEHMMLYIFHPLGGNPQAIFFALCFDDTFTPTRVYNVTAGYWVE